MKRCKPEADNTSLASEVITTASIDSFSFFVEVFTEILTLPVMVLHILIRPLLSAEARTSPDWAIATDVTAAVCPVRVALKELCAVLQIFNK